MVRWWKMKNDKLNGIFIEAVLGVDKAERVIFNSFPLSESGGFCLFSLTFGTSTSKPSSK